MSLNMQQHRKVEIWMIGLMKNAHLSIKFKEANWDWWKQS